MAALAEKPQVVSVRFAKPPAAATTAPPVDLITCEYAPTVGGVADYSREVANGLVRAGVPVRVWSAGSGGAEQTNPNLTVNRSLGRFGFVSLIRAGHAMRRSGGGKTILLQWEPVGFGAKSLNVPFCLWIAWQVLRGSKLIVMFHETFLSYAKRTPQRFLAATLQRLMALLLVNAATKTFASTEQGAEAVDQLNLLRDAVEHLPVFSNIQPCNDAEYSRNLRARFVSQNGTLVGHFGRYNTQVEALTVPALASLLVRDPHVKVLLAGECADTYKSAIERAHPELASRVHSAGICSDSQISALIGACDFMFQPYPDGITTRRSTTMAALRNGRMIISNGGASTESLWKGTPAIHLLLSTNPADQAAEISALAYSPIRIAEGGTAARRFYETNFSAERTLQVLEACLRSS